VLRFSGSGDIKVAVRDYFESRDDLDGKLVVDIPAGSGDNSAVLRRRGARVEAYDLFPEFFKAEGLECKPADLRRRLPVPDHHADLVLFQEAIEHLPDQLGVLQELNRIIKPGGTLVLTTPNISHLRARLSNLLVESELYSRLPINESDAVWHSDGKGNSYLGHLFLIGAQRLRVLAKIAGFRLTTIVPVKVSPTSLFLGIFYPLLALFGYLAYLRDATRLQGKDSAERRAVLRRVLRLNLHPTILFGKHLFLVLHKEAEAGDAVPEVYKASATIC
jgi:SAM-dependent methyltransferase